MREVDTSDTGAAFTLDVEMSGIKVKFGSVAL